jgi:hypothetical protein
MQFTIPSNSKSPEKFSKNLEEVAQAFNDIPNIFQDKSTGDF